MSKVSPMTEAQRTLLKSQLEKVMDERSMTDAEYYEEGTVRDIVAEQASILKLGESLFSKYKELDEEFQRQDVITKTEEILEGIRIILDYEVGIAREDYAKVLYQIAYVGYVIASVNAKQLSESGKWGEGITFEDFSANTLNRQPTSTQSTQNIEEATS